VAVVLAIVVSVAIAIWQHRDAVRYRRAENERATRVAEQERQRELRRGRQESWEPVYLEIQETLVKLEDIESEVREQGPLDREMIDGADLGRLQRRLVNLSGRCPDTLRVPLQEVSAAVAALRSISIDPDRDITSDYAVAAGAGAVATAGPAVAIPARAIGARAITQYRAATDVHQAIARAWDAVHYERGEKV
jgi:hypothetical protein